MSGCLPGLSLEWLSPGIQMLMSPVISPIGVTEGGRTDLILPGMAVTLDG